MASASVFNWGEVRGESAGGVDRRQIEGGGADLKRIEIAAGTVAGKHDHAFEQFVQVLEGGGRLQCDAGEIELKPGTVLHFPAGSWHSAVFDKDTVLVEVNLRPGA